MLQTNPIHQSQHGVLHADESFKALLVYSRYHKWLPEDGCLQLDLFFLYSIFLFLNEVLVFLWVFWGGFVFCLVLMMPSEYPLPVSGSTWEHFPVAVEVYPPWLLCFLCIFFKTTTGTNWPTKENLILLLHCSVIKTKTRKTQCKDDIFAKV